MNIKSYAFQVGKLECFALLDGTSLVDLERFMRRFPDGTEAAYRQAHADIGLTLEEAESSLNILVVKLDHAVILIDSGEGSPKGGNLLASMAQAGIDPHSITHVILTHSHGDHVQGLLTETHTPTFPNATYIISQEELNFWEKRITANLPEQRAIVEMLQTRGLRTIALDEVIMAGVQAVPLMGHTPGQIGLLFESEGQKLLHLADALHSPMQFAHPDWSPMFDADKQLSTTTRRRVLDLATDEHTLTMFYHLTFPGLGRVQRATSEFAWQPLKP